MSTETQKPAEGESKFFNEYDQELLETGIPQDMRLSVSESVHFQRAGRDLWEDEIPYPPEKAAQHTGEYNMMNSSLCFVDRNGAAWMTGDGPNQRKALKRAGYRLNENMNVPFANGELLNEHKKTSDMESQQKHWERIKGLARRDWEELRQKEEYPES